MYNDFNSVEAELREIEADFASGRMNAFGSAQVQDSFLRELKRIAEVETKIFYKTCSILKSGNSEDHTLLTNVFASAQPPPQARGSSGPGPGSTTGRASSSSRTHRGSAGGGVPDSPQGSPSSSPAPLHTDAAPQPARGGETAAMGGGWRELPREGPAPHVKPSEWCNEAGFPDRAFEDVAERFRMLEADFGVLGGQLRQIAQHVTQLNDMSEEVSRQMAAGTNTNTAAGVAEDVGVGGGRGSGDAAMTPTRVAPVMGVGGRGVPPLRVWQEGSDGGSARLGHRESVSSGLDGDMLRNSFESDPSQAFHAFEEARGRGGGGAQSPDNMASPLSQTRYRR